MQYVFQGFAKKTCGYFVNRASSLPWITRISNRDGQYSDNNPLFSRIDVKDTFLPCSPHVLETG